MFNKKRTIHRSNGNNKNISTLYIAAVICFAGLLIIGSFVFIYKIMADVKINQKKSDAMYIAQEVDYYLAKNKENLKLAASNIENYINEGKSHEEILAYMEQESRATSTVVDENFSGIYGWIDGEYLDGMGYDPDESYVPQKRPWYIKAMNNNGEAVFVTPYIDTQTGRIVLSISKMLEDGDSVLSMDIYLDYLQKLVNEKEEYKEHLIIVDETGTIVASENESNSGVAYYEPQKLGGLFTVDRKSANYSIYETYYKGKHCYCYDQTIIGDWHVILMAEKSEILSNLQYVYFVCFLVMALAFAILVALFDRMNKQRIAAQGYSDSLSAVADIYLCMYEINMIEDTFKEVKSLPFIRDVVSKYEGKASEIIVNIISELCDTKERSKIEVFADLTTMKLRLKNSSFVTMELKGIVHSVRITFVVKNRNEFNNVTNVMLLIEDITDELLKRQQLMKEANTDKMTGLFNRRAWENALDDVRQLNSIDNITVIEMDLNRLKIVNDNLGHLAGDEIIAASGKIINDYWGKYGDCYRIGGDEFVVLCMEVLKNPDELIEGFKNKVALWQGKMVDSLGISIGYAIGKDEKVHAIGDLIKIADERMYDDKAKNHAIRQ